MDVDIRLLDASELGPWTDGLRKQLVDNGRDGAYFSTLLTENADERFTPERLLAAQAAVAVPVHQPGWMRVFGAWQGAMLVGHADLKGGPSAADRHRCTLGIGLVRDHQGRGLGERLLRAAIAWAAGEGLTWMDLGVFAGNARAIALYQKLGFVEQGRVTDRYRIGDTSVSEILMALALTRADA